ncbi:hypothetical protein Dimus_001494 [Dionaea muscipula]
MPGFNIFALVGCMNGCQDYGDGESRLGTRIWNLSDWTIELQVRVESVLKKVHTLKPGSSKRFNSESIYRAYMPNTTDGRIEDGGKAKRLVYYYDEMRQPYVWIHDTARGGFSRMVNQQYVSLEDLRDCSEIRIYRDHQRGCISVRKKPRVAE